MYKSLKKSRASVPWNDIFQVRQLIFQCFALNKPNPSAAQLGLIAALTTMYYNQGSTLDQFKEDLLTMADAIWVWKKAE